MVLLEHPRFFAAERVPAGATCVQADLAHGESLEGNRWHRRVNGNEATMAFIADGAHT